LLAWGSTETVLTGRQDVRLWAGLADETFYVDAFAGTTGYAIVLEIPDSAFRAALEAARQIGFWGTTALATDVGGWQPINRVGQPLIQALFNPAETERACEYNTTHPAEDRGNYGELFGRLIARSSPPTAQPTIHSPTERPSRKSSYPIFLAMK